MMKLSNLGRSILGRVETDFCDQIFVGKQRNCIPRLGRQFSSFPVIGDSQEQRPPVQVGSDSEESEEEHWQASEPESATVIREGEHFSLSPS